LLFDTGAAITLINKHSFDMAFSDRRPRKISNALSCATASGDTMNSLGIFDNRSLVKEKNTHPVNVIHELIVNIISIDIIYAHQLTYHIIARQVKFTGTNANTIAALKQTILPAMASTVVNAKIIGKLDPKATYIKIIYASKTPMISGISQSYQLIKTTTARLSSKAVYFMMSPSSIMKYWVCWILKQTNLFH